MDRRNIIVKLLRRDLKSEIFLACKAKKPKFYANESLTPVRNSIMFALRKIRRSGNEGLIKGIFSTNGRVFAWIKPEQNSDRTVKILINCRERLEKFCVENVGKPLNDFDVRWP